MSLYKYNIDQTDTRVKNSLKVLHQLINFIKEYATLSEDLLLVVKIISL